MKITFIKCMLILILFSCNKNNGTPEIIESQLPYTVRGSVVGSFGNGVQGIKIMYDTSQFVLTDETGNWTIPNLNDQHSLSPMAENYTFSPTAIQVEAPTEHLIFTANRVPNEKEAQVFTWFDQQQLANGLLESVENGNIVSLYDNALASLVFMLNEDFNKAEKIFDFFNDRINSELQKDTGGFSQFRDRDGVPNNHRWMGDNAWLLIALNNYKAMTSNSTYDALALALSEWLVGLQDSDGGLFAGYKADNALLNYKVTEGNIDAFNAVDGYHSFHRRLLDFLENNRWDETDHNLVAWPENPTYLYALDNHSWSYCIFNNYDISSLSSADRFLTTQTATINNAQINGYDIDEDKDMVFIEGTGQMALAFSLAKLKEQSDYYLTQMEKVLVQSPSFDGAAGFPYASNIGTGFGSDPLWTGADTKIAISGGAWYLFAKYGFNPFAVGRKKDVPVADMFWVD